MSIVTSLQSQVRRVRAKGVSTATAASAAKIHLTLSGWPTFAKVERVILSANNSFTNPTVTILSGGAAHRAAAAGDKPALIQAVATLTASSVTAARIDFADEYVEDPFYNGLVHVMITTDGTFTTGTVFNVTVEGRAMLPSTMADADRGTPVRRTHTFRALRLEGTKCTDIGKELKGNGNPYLIGSVNEGAEILKSATDWLYLGDEGSFEKVMVNLVGGNSLPSGTTLTAQYWNGSTWATLTVQDDTSDGQTAPSTLSYSGVIKWSAPASWAKTQIDEDPMKVMGDAIKAGTYPPQGAFYNPDRYWIRLQASPMSSSIRAKTILPLL